ncbi:MAG TPA: DUF6624 domain-containing protein [Sphingomicrobium sp.]|nr:DUF6624 domain-containing protein [Sphingomicrobium sp.]
MNESLRRELLERARADDALREELANEGSLFDGYHPAMEVLHRRNAARLRQILDSHGWPGKSVVGPDGAEAAWRIVQHSIGEPEFMRSCVSLIEEAAASGEADGAHLAFLVDRIRTLEARPQLYGTQYDWNAERDAMVPMNGIEDTGSVNERRRAVGLPPLEWRRSPPPGEPPPTESFEDQESRLNAWARQVGWR